MQQQKIKKCQQSTINIKKQAKYITQIIKEYRKIFQAELQKNPDSKIKEIYNKFQNNHSQSFYNKIKNYNQLITYDQLENYMQSEIWVPYISKIEVQIEKELRKSIKELLQSINIEQEFVFEQFYIQLDNAKYNIDTNFPKTLIQMHQIIFTNPKQYNGPQKQDIIIRANVINNFLEQLFIALMNIIQQVYIKYDIFEIYENIQQNLVDQLYQLLENAFQKNQNEVYSNFQKSLQNQLQFVQTKCKDEIKLNMSLSSNKNNITNYANYLSFSKELKDMYKEQLKKSIQNTLTYVPHELFLKSYYLKIETDIDNQINYYLQINQQQLNQSIKPLLEKNLNDLIIQQFNNLFFYSNEILDNLFSIIACSFHHFRYLEEYNYFKEIVMRLYEKYFSQSLSQKFRAIYQNFYLNYDNFIINQAEIIEKLQESMNFWKQQISEQQNLQIILHLYLGFSQISMENNKIIVSKQNSLWRYFLQQIVQNLNNGNYSYFNWQIVNLLDEVVEEQLIYHYSIRKQNLIHSDLNITIENQLQNCNYDYLKKLRTNSYSQKELEQSLKIVLNKIKIENKINQDIPNKFVFQKLSDPSKVSRMIIICISGFLSEEDNKQEKWQQLFQKYPNYEFYSLNYNSKKLLEFIFSIKGGIPKFITKKLLRFAWFGYSLYDFYFNNLFIQAYDQAELCGKYLAYILADQIIFPNCIINLIGFSLGTQVIQSCLEELHVMGKANVINEVLLMGGVADVNKIQKLDRIKSISGKLINVYTKKDYILKYIFNFFKINIKTVGLNNIINNGKIFNYDLSHLIDGHLYYLQHITDIISITNFNHCCNDIKI